MHGMQVVDRKIAVEQAAVAERAKEPGDANPYAQIQAHQLQHVMAAQIQQSSLAAQVAAMRVQAKTNPASAAPPGALLLPRCRPCTACCLSALLSPVLMDAATLLHPCRKVVERGVVRSRLRAE